MKLIKLTTVLNEVDVPVYINPQSIRLFRKIDSDDPKVKTTILFDKEHKLFVREGSDEILAIIGRS